MAPFERIQKTRVLLSRYYIIKNVKRTRIRDNLRISLNRTCYKSQSENLE